MGMIREWLSGFVFFVAGLVMGFNYRLPWSLEAPLHAVVFFVLTLVLMYQITQLPKKSSPSTAEGAIMALIFVWGFLATGLFAHPNGMFDSVEFVMVFGIAALMVAIPLFFIGSLELLKSQQAVWLGGFVLLGLLFIGSILLYVANSLYWQFPGLGKTLLYIAAIDFLSVMLVVLVTRQTVEVSEYWKNKPDASFATLFHWYLFAQASVWVTLLFRPDVIWKLFGL